LWYPQAELPAAALSILNRLIFKEIHL